MTTPAMPRPGGLRLLDLLGLVVGYGMAALLARSFWPRSLPLTGLPAAFLGIEYLWLGLAMSGPIVLLIGRKSFGEELIRPARPGRLIAEVGVDEPPPSEPEAERYTRAELAWLAIGGYWVALTLFVVAARSVTPRWALAGALPLVAVMAVSALIPPRPKSAGSPVGWTHGAAVALLWTWPFEWIVLVLLTKMV